MTLIKNMIGERFGKLTILERTKNNKHNQVCYICLCDCGATATITSGKLKNGNTKSCGCLRGQGKGDIKRDPSKREDLTGNKYGRLTVLGFAETINEHTRFHCICDCGNKTITSRQGLLRGTTVSCGCYHSDIMKLRTGIKNSSYKHGLTRNHKLWDTFHHMKGRCYRRKDKSFISYGARGISVCRIWRDNVDRFAKWAIKNGYQDDFEIDRINNNGPYAPWNCQFIPKEENIKKRFMQSKRYLPL